MVLSTTKRTSSISSIVNKNCGGGEKKAGLLPQIGKTAAVSLFYHSGGNSNLKNLTTNRFKIFPNQNRPIGFSPGIQMR